MARARGMDSAADGRKTAAGQPCNQCKRARRKRHKARQGVHRALHHGAAQPKRRGIQSAKHTQNVLGKTQQHLYIRPTLLPTRPRRAPEYVGHNGRREHGLCNADKASAAHAGGPRSPPAPRRKVAAAASAAFPQGCTHKTPRPGAGTAHRLPCRAETPLPSAQGFPHTCAQGGCSQWRPASRAENRGVHSRFCERARRRRAAHR